jgi:hypothetical protein
MSAIRPEFVIGGHMLGSATFDALILPTINLINWLYVARPRNAFAPEIRVELMKRFGKLRRDKCPLANLPKTRTGRGEWD